MLTDRNGLEVLDRDDSLQLLGHSPIGRVIVSVGALPAAFPVNFALLGDDVVFQTGAGTKLQAAMRNAVVAFEVDDFDRFGHSGWSVLVTGHAQEITDPDEVAVVRRLPLNPWLPKHPDAYVRIKSELVTGRRFGYDTVALAGTR